jgi:hypothetical protein
VAEPASAARDRKPLLKDALIQLQVAFLGFVLLVLKQLLKFFEIRFQDSGLHAI